MKVVLDTQRRITLPKSLASVQPGDQFEIEFDAEEDAILFRRVGPNATWLDVLEACPVRMDDLRARRFRSQI